MDGEWRRLALDHGRQLELGRPQNGDSVTIGPTPTTARPHVTGMPGGVSLQDLTLTNSSLDGGGGTVKGDLTWNAAENVTSVLNARLTVRGSATLAGAGLKDSTAPLILEGATNVTDSLVRVDDNGPAITNSGTFTLQPGTEVEGSACCVSLKQFINTGTLRMATAGSATMAAMDLHDNGSISVTKGSPLMVTLGPVELTKGVGITGSGTVDFDQGALVALASRVSIAPAVTVQLNGSAKFTGTGGFTGTLAVPGSKKGVVGIALMDLQEPWPITVGQGSTLHVTLAFANAGQVKLVNGTFTVSGTGYRQSASGVRAVTATGTKAGSNYGQLIVNGNAALAGTISVTAGGSFKPKAGQALAVLSYHARTGKFAKTAGKAKFKVSYKASGASIRFS